MNQAREKLEASQATTSLYENFHLAPYFGIRLRGNRVPAVKTVPEVGIRFSMPLGFIKLRNQKYQQFKARETAWKWQAKQTAFELKKDLASTMDKYLLLESQIKKTQLHKI